MTLAAEHVLAYDRRIAEYYEELPAGEEEAVMCRLFDLAAHHPRLIFGGFTGLGWKKADEPAMRELHRRMNAYYARGQEREHL